MTAQLILTIALILAAAGYLGWRFVRFGLGLRAGRCGGGCGCGDRKKTDGAFVRSEELVLRKR